MYIEIRFVIDEVNVVSSLAVFLHFHLILLNFVQFFGGGHLPEEFRIFLEIF